MKACLVSLSVCAALLVASVSFCRQKSGEKSAGKDSQVYAELAKVPEKAQQKANPFANDAGAVRAGHALFERHCAECHGDTAEGQKGPSLRAREVQDAAPGTIFWLLTNGVVRRGMPVWSRLPEPQRWQLVSYIKALGVTPADKSSATAIPQP